MKHELVMPKRYTDLSEDEMEYDGGLLNFLVAAVATVTSVAATYAGNAGLISQSQANAINAVCAVVGIACTLGTLGLVTAANTAAQLGKTTIAISTVRGVVEKSTTEILTNGVRSVAADIASTAASEVYSLR